MVSSTSSDPPKVTIAFKFSVYLREAFNVATFLWQEFSVEILEWSGKSWEPYVADDVQVQFYMMSPYVLKTLSTDKKVTYF